MTHLSRERSQPFAIVTREEHLHECGLLQHAVQRLDGLLTKLGEQQLCLPESSESFRFIATTTNQTEAVNSEFKTRSDDTRDLRANVRKATMMSDGLRSRSSGSATSQQKVKLGRSVV